MNPFKRKVLKNWITTSKKKLQIKTEDDCKIVLEDDINFSTAAASRAAADAKKNQSVPSFSFLPFMMTKQLAARWRGSWG